MGNHVIRVPRAKPTVATSVSKVTYDRVVQAARVMDQPVAAWLRLAIMEKLDRDGGRS